MPKNLKQKYSFFAELLRFRKGIIFFLTLYTFKTTQLFCAVVDFFHHQLLFLTILESLQNSSSVLYFVTVISTTTGMTTTTTPATTTAALTTVGKYTSNPCNNASKSREATCSRILDSEYKI